MDKYLQKSEYIDWDAPEILKQASLLSFDCDTDEAIARKCFEFVRDSIRHSWDYKQNPVTCRASDVLMHRTGYCYAKSHLLAALLRANRIPAGLCYQRLSVTGNGSPYSLHGFNAIFLKAFGWYRVDARGNRSDIFAEFHPPVVKLAFSCTDSNEREFPEIWADPLPEVISVLTRSNTYIQVYENLPDVPLKE